MSFVDKLLDVEGRDGEREGERALQNLSVLLPVEKLSTLRFERVINFCLFC